MELNAWPHLLRLREITVQRKAHEWWFHLHQLINNLPQDDSAVTESNQSLDSMQLNKENHFEWLTTGCRPVIDYLEELIKILDEYLLTSPVGEFDTRLAMLSALSRQIQMEIDMGMRSHTIAQLSLSRIVVNMVNFYSQFRESVMSHIDDQRKPIEKELKEHVKLCRWDDQTFFSLKESTTKAHRKLAKLSRSYAEVLEVHATKILDQHDQPIKDGNIPIPQIQIAKNPSSLEQIAKSTLRKLQGCKIDEQNGLPLWVEWLKSITEREDSTIYQYFKRGPWLMNRICQVCEQELSGTVNETRVSAMMIPSQLANAAMDRISSLQSPKTSKALKQKALIDLFKTLKDEGVTKSPIHYLNEIR